MIPISIGICGLRNNVIIRAGEAPAEPMRRHARQEPRTPVGFQSSNDLGVIKRFLALVLVLFAFSNVAFADDSSAKIREGMRFYSAEQFEEASKSFAAATESLEKAKSDKAAIAAFDEACALHRKGDFELARERYLKAGLSQDKGIATSAHFNMGVIASEQARKLAGEKPETVPADKRKEILAEISRSIDSYRHCLELNPKHVQARRNLELLRQWIKYYTDQWREADLQKRRDETNLVQFLEYLVQAQESLKTTSQGLGPNTSPNAFAELKRVQEELRDEIPYLKDKIDSELRPKQDDAKSTASKSISAQEKEDLERGIALLSKWADEAGAKMADAGKELMRRDANSAADKQQQAADQLDQIWDAVVPFHPLLASQLAQQTQIAEQLTPPTSNQKQESLDDSSDKSAEAENQQPQQKLEVNDRDWSQLLKKQERVLRKARLLAPKAESELAQMESQFKAQETANATPRTEGETEQEKPNVDPEAIQAGYQKAIELAPKAVEEMVSAVTQLGNQELRLSATHAEEARRILKEIQDAQPKNPDQDQQEQNKDQDKDQQQDSEQKKDNEQEKEKKDDEQDKPDEKKQDQQQDEKKEDKKDKDKPSEKRPEPKVSQDRIEEALRRVREREQEKRERDRELRARILGRVPVDKDW